MAGASHVKDEIPVDPGCGLDVEAVRGAFPILAQQVHDRALVYLDNAATTHKPTDVIDAVDRFYRCDNANVHRGVHLLSQRATDAYEAARARVQRFVNAQSAKQIVFVRGTTEAINLVAQGYARPRVKEGDEILLSEMEHHSNIVPWQMLCEQTGATLRVIPIDDRGQLDMEAYRRLLNERTALVAIAHASNALGTVNPIETIIQQAHAVGAKVVVDGAQAAAHLPIDVQQLDCDFYAFSGHKVYGPTGIGALYAKAELLDQMSPYQGGGDMIASVRFEKTTYAAPPAKFEAGTPNIAGAVGLAAALDYLAALPWSAVESHERAVTAAAVERIGSFPGVRLIGEAERRIGVVSFVVEGIHPHDLGTVLDHHGVAVRAGHHCAQPVMQRFKIPATVRASFAVYNRESEIIALIEGLKRARELFGA